MEGSGFDGQTFGNMKPPPFALSWRWSSLQIDKPGRGGGHGDGKAGKTKKKRRRRKKEGRDTERPKRAWNISTKI
jgi:hypothetical protein